MECPGNLGWEENNREDLPHLFILFRGPFSFSSDQRGLLLESFLSIPFQAAAAEFRPQDITGTTKEFSKHTCLIM